MSEEICNRKFLLKFTDIIRYIGDGVRCYIKGERLYLANHVLFCGITEEILDKTHVFALCIKSTDVNGMPYQLNIELKCCINETKIEKCNFECPAGSLGKCKHCVAVLYFLQA